MCDVVASAFRAPRVFRGPLFLACASSLLVACAREAGSAGNDAVDTAAATVADRNAARAAELSEPDRAADSLIVSERLAQARAQRLDTLPFGTLITTLGRTFVGTPYVPQTLETPGPERLVINLRAMDCVTFVENVLALARTVRSGGSFADFAGELQRLRYRTGEIAGYPSRLHYFSEWIAANEEKGLLTDITRELGGVVDPERIGFMSANRNGYRQLADDSVLAAIRALEARLADRPRYYLPEDRIAAAVAGIAEGDVIAATSTLPGLDIAHTGIAVRENGALHLMHAPLVGDSVEISELPLAERIRSLDRQDGIMVARPR